MHQNSGSDQSQWEARPAPQLVGSIAHLQSHGKSHCRCVTPDTWRALLEENGTSAQQHFHITELLLDSTRIAQYYNDTIKL
jgi:hypothetical protein